MSGLKLGESSKEALDLQKKINAVRKSTVVQESGAFDKETQTALIKLQKDLKVTASGLPDKATMEAIAFNLVPRSKVTLYGTDYFLNKSEMKEARMIAAGIAVQQLSGYITLLQEAKIYYKSLEEWRSKSVVADAVELMTGATFPSFMVFAKADVAAYGMIDDAKAFKMFDVHARSKPIVEALNQISQYRNKVQTGTAQLATGLDGIAAVAAGALVIIGAIGGAVPITSGVIIAAGSAGGVAFIQTMRKETKTHKFDGAISKSIKEAAAAAVEAAILHYVMKGPTGFAKFMDGVAEAAIKKFAKGGFAAPLKAYVINSLKDSITTITGETVKILGKGIAKPGTKVSEPDIVEAMAKAVITAFLLKRVSSVGEKYFTNASKQFDGSELFKGMNLTSSEVAKAYASGVSAVVKSAGKSATEEQLKQLKPGGVAKLEKQIRDAILKNPKVQKAAKTAAKNVKSKK